MSGKAFKLRILGKPSINRRLTNPNNNAEAKVARKRISEKEEQLLSAVEWCHEHNVRGYSAIKSGLFPLVKNRRTVDKRLDGKIITGNEKVYCSILTPEEEESVVNYVKNKNRSYQGVNKADLTKVILNVLKVRQHLNRRHGGRSYQKLSDHACNALKSGQLSRSFWRRWNAKHSDIVLKRQGNVPIKRALNCTKEMAIKHLDGLAEELKVTGIFKNAVKVEPGVWSGEIDTSRVFNHDETPQFVNYGVDGTPSGLVFAAKGEACKKLQNENRESVTIHPFVSFSGEVCLCHVIFAATGITSHMAPQEAVEKIENLLISNTGRGSQDHTSLLAAYKKFDQYLSNHHIERPVVILSDGHTSRFDYEVLKFLQEKSMRLFLGPPDTTGLTQLLDQVNKGLHLAYKDEKKLMFTPAQTISREGFMQILANAWDKWVTMETLVKCARRVGVTTEGLSVEFMQKDKMAQSDMCFTETEVESTPPTLQSPSTPKNPLRSSADHWKRKYQNLKEQYDKEMEARGVSLEEIPGLLTIDKVRKHKPSSTNTRVTQVYGSMEGKEVIKLVKEINDEKERKVVSKEKALQEKQELKENFYRCKEQCICNEAKCNAFGLKECPNCHNILRSVCSKIACRGKDGSKPTMISGAGCNSSLKKKLKVIDDQDEDSDEENLYSSEDDVIQKENSDEDGEDEIKVGDFVKIVKKPYFGYYAVVLDASYGDELEIQYCEKKYGKWVMKEKDFYSREPTDMVKVEANAEMDENIIHYTFTE